MKKFLLLILIFIVSLFLRLYKLGDIPSGMNWDEAGLGYTAYSILKTGRDEWGIRFPLFTKQFGEYKSAMYPYLAAISIRFFGLNNFAVRLPSALAGVLTVVVLFFLINGFFGLTSLKKDKEKLAFIASIIFAINPWHLHFTRQCLSSNIALTYTLIGLTLMFKFLKNKKAWQLLGAVIFAVLAVYTYHSYRLVVPLLYLTILIIDRKIFYHQKKLSFICLIIGFIMMIPLYLSLQKGYLTARASQVTLVSSEEYQNRVNQLLKENVKLRVRGISFFNNQWLAMAEQLLRNELTHFSVDFLFLGKDANLRYGTGWYGKFYYLDIILLVLGFISFGQLKDKRKHFLLMWFLIAPLPAALSNESPHPIRAFTLLPVIIIFISMGWLKLINIFDQSIFRWFWRPVVFASYGLLFILYLNYYYVHFNLKSEYAWQAMYKQPILYLIKKINPADYKKIYFSNYYGQPHIFLFYYQQTSPEKVQAILTRGNYNSILNSAIDQFENYAFIADPWEGHKKEKDALIIDSQLHIEALEPANEYGVKLLQSYYFFNGDHAFSIYETAKSN